jgi:phosphodiesterase/alkaline phosphatase D-like protein
MPTGKFTTPPAFTSDPVANPKATAVTITWTTNRPSNSIVQYGLTTSYGQEVSKSTESVTDHEIEILGLTPGSTYHFRAQSLDADRDYDPNTAFSEDYIFRTSQAPGISNVNTTEVRLTSAIITWQTTSSASSKILYGKTTSYGETYTDNSGSQTTTHTVKLTGLSDSTTYHYRIQGTDIEGNVLVSDDYVFETLTFPRLSDLDLRQIPTATTSTVELTFRSNVPTTSQVTFSGPGRKDSANYDLLTEHRILVAGLLDNTQYEITVRGRDQYGNEASSLSRSYKTDFDTRPPAVTDITTETEVTGLGLDAKGQVIVSWETDEPSTSQVEFGIGSSGSYTNKTQEDSALSTTHVVIISDLKPSSPYHFRVVSKDSSDNEVKSEEFTALTPQASRSIFEAILGALDRAIGWMFRR